MIEQNNDLPVLMPETLVASKFAMTASVSEFVLAVGRVRVGYSDGGVPSTQIVEYPYAYSLSPTSAKQLQLILQAGLRDYEAKYGPIPSDESASARLLQGKEVTVEGGKIIQTKVLPAKKATAKKR